jgi:heterodisulfide reductase subunit B
MTRVGYYPGCSLHGSGIELDLSIRAISEAAGVALREIEDWNCCGATAAHNLNHDLAVALPYRVLALAEAQGLTEVLAPCAACFSRLKGTSVRLARAPELVARMQEITGLPYRGALKFLNIIEYVNRLLADGLVGKLTAPLGGMKVAAYYGCLLSRGEGIIEGDSAENPTGMEAAIRAAGCEPVAWNFATECCGGGFSMSMTEAVTSLSGAILEDALAAGAQAIVAGCPMCHSNLDMRQLAVNAAGMGPYDMPILYLSELIGLAAGLEPKSLGLNRHFIDAMRVVEPKPGAAERSA